MSTNTGSKLLRLNDVSEMTSLGKTTIKLWVAQGRFPAPSVLSKTIKVWRQRDIEKWINDLSGGPEEVSLTVEVDASNEGGQHAKCDHAEVRHG